MPISYEIKIIPLLQSLSAWERKRFQKFIHSPYFNTDQKLIKLLDVLFQNLETGSIDREELDAIIHPEGPFQYDRITNYLSYLTRHFENFLAYERIKKDDFY